MPDFDPELLDQLLAGADPETMFESDGLFKQLKAALAERMLEAEMTHHLGYEKHDPAGNVSGNSRNGHTTKTVTTNDGQFQLKVPRDRDG
ncbi:MAG: putative transposase, partial [Myxococcota bacterium]